MQSQKTLRKRTTSLYLMPQATHADARTADLHHLVTPEENKTSQLHQALTANVSMQRKNLWMPHMCMNQIDAKMQTVIASLRHTED